MTRKPLSLICAAFAAVFGCAVCTAQTSAPGRSYAKPGVHGLMGTGSSASGEPCETDEKAENCYAGTAPSAAALLRARQAVEQGKKAVDPQAAKVLPSASAAAARPEISAPAANAAQTPAPIVAAPPVPQQPERDHGTSRGRVLLAAAAAICIAGCALLIKRRR